MAKIKAIVLPGYWASRPPDDSTYGSFVYVENNKEYIGVCFRAWADPKLIRTPQNVIVQFSRDGCDDIWEAFLYSQDEWIAEDNKFKKYLHRAELAFITGAY